MEKIELGKLVTIRTGKLDANASSEDGLFPFFTCSINPLKISSYSYDCECVLVAGNGDLNVKYYNGKFDAYQRTYILESKDKSVLDVKYLYRFMSLYIEILRTQTIGGVIKYIKLGNLTQAIIPLIDLESQVEIVKYLEKIELIISKRQSQLAALDELANNVFLEKFGDPKDKESIHPFVKLSEACIKITDGTHHSPHMVSEGIPYISAKHLRKGYLDFYSNPSYISKEDHINIFKRCNPEKGDVLYIKDGATTGIAAINHYDFEFSMLSSLALIKPDLSKLNNYYLAYYLNNQRVKENILNQMNGGAIKRLTIKKINNLGLLLPPIELQIEFMIFIKKNEEQKALLKKSLSELKELYNSSLQKAFQ